MSLPRDRRDDPLHNHVATSRRGRRERQEVYSQQLSHHRHDDDRQERSRRQRSDPSASIAPIFEIPGSNGGISGGIGESNEKQSRLSAEPRTARRAARPAKRHDDKHRQKRPQQQSPSAKKSRIPKPRRQSEAKDHEQRLTWRGEIIQSVFKSHQSGNTRSLPSFPVA